VHLFDWKRTVGPLEKRPEQKFGLPEFLQNCADIGAVPLITIADYFGAAQDAADLVEYLNAPNLARVSASDNGTFVHQPFDAHMTIRRRARIPIPPLLRQTNNGGKGFRALRFMWS
jgi:alpha-L-arabinofuranosidase